MFFRSKRQKGNETRQEGALVERVEKKKDMSCEKNQKGLGGRGARA